jgi:NAD(P)-dependent dehydrogenase (short-subunit alcohol dehydrogenase family)
VPADVRDFEQVEEVADRAVDRFGRIDTWINNAAVALWASAEATTPEEYRRVIEVNLLGQIYGALAALPHLKREGRGALIHVTSVEALRTLPLHAAYGASKHGVLGFLDALRTELKHDGIPISVTNVLPATINTPLFSKARTKIGVQPKGIPPVYHTRVAVDAILHAAEHPRRDIFAGGAGRSLAMLQNLSPRLLDAALARWGYGPQHSNRPKSVTAPDNLFEPVAGYDRIEGDYSDESRRSIYTWLTTRPMGFRFSVRGAVLSGLALGIWMLLWRRER